LHQALDVKAATTYQLAISDGPQISDVNKAARDYLTQSGARPICIVETERVCEFLLN
jgi:hypothetical protein